MSYLVHKAIELTALSAKVKATLPSKRWVVSPKYDGCHAVFMFDEGRFIRAMSRTGETVLSMNHVANYLLDHYSDLLKRHGRVAIAGEAWSGKLAFNEISGLFRRHSPSPALGFVPFDILSWTGHGNTLLSGFLDFTYIERLTLLQTARCVSPSNIEYPRFHLAETGGFTGDDFECVVYNATVYAHQLKHLGGYDGSVIAQADAKYTVGSGKGGEFIKIKPLLSESVVVIGRDCSTGEKTGKHTASLVFQLDGLAQKVSTGLTQEQVDEIVTDFAKWDGKTIEVAAMGKTVNGYLREPRFVGLRTDVIN